MVLCVRERLNDLEVMRAWVVEATEREWFLAWTEQAYSWRLLARAVELTG